jgi:poly(3-hydroxyoctanoate) depolymerase
LKSGSHVVVGGLRLRVDVRGNGPPLLLLMGIGGHLNMWEPLRRQLGAFTSIAFDAPGTGESDVLRRPLRLPGLARLTISLLDSLGVDRAAVLGYSFGGLLAQELARRLPERVERLVLASTTCGVGAVPGRPAALAALCTPWRYYSGSYFDAVAPQVFGGRMRAPFDPSLRDARLQRPPSPVGYTQQLFAMMGWSSLPWLHNLVPPTLVMSGDDDPIVPAINARVLARRIPRARLVIIRGGGHLMLLDSAAEVAPVITDFVRPPENRPGELASGTGQQP